MLEQNIVWNRLHWYWMGLIMPGSEIIWCGHRYGDHYHCSVWFEGITPGVLAGQGLGCQAHCLHKTGLDSFHHHTSPLCSLSSWLQSTVNPTICYWFSKYESCAPNVDSLNGWKEAKDVSVEKMFWVFWQNILASFGQLQLRCERLGGHQRPETVTRARVGAASGWVMWCNLV